MQREDLLLKQSIFLLFLLAAYISGAEPWRTPVSKWSQNDANRVLNQSPWAIPTQATMDDPKDQEEQPLPAPPAGEGQPGARSTSGPNNMRWDGAISKNRIGQLATIPVMVRWDSAGVVRQALALNHDAGASALAAAAPGNFIIEVDGLLPARQDKQIATLQGKSSSDDDGARARTAEEMLEWFMTNSHLLVKGENSIEPQNVRIDAENGTVFVYFKRRDDLLEHKKDVLFVTRFGSMSVQTRFRTKDMMVDGHPDL